MVGFEFSIYDKIEKCHSIGILAERRKSPLKDILLLGRVFVLILHLKHENIQWRNM